MCITLDKEQLLILIGALSEYLMYKERDSANIDYVAYNNILRLLCEQYAKGE